MVTIAERQQIEAQGFAKTGDVGGQPRITYYTPDGRVIRAMPDMHEYALKDAKGNPEILAFVRKKIESAHWLIQAVRQRQRTLYDIAKSITEFQVDFMEHGPTAIKALKMQTIADLVGVHISTISRAIKCKYMQTPWGTFEMRHFFTGGVERTDGGGIESRRNIYRD